MLSWHPGNLQKNCYNFPLNWGEPSYPDVPETMVLNGVDKQNEYEYDYGNKNKNKNKAEVCKAANGCDNDIEFLLPARLAVLRCTSPHRLAIL